MKIFALFSCLLLLTGCGVQTVGLETVSDPVSSTEIPFSYGISVGLPETVLTDELNGYRRYETEGLRVETSVFQAMNAEDAVRTLSGFEATRLTIFQTTRDDLPEYRFAWYSQTETGGRLYRAHMVMDGMTCCAVVCSAPEGVGDSPWAEARQVFSSFSLTKTEIV